MPKFITTYNGRGRGVHNAETTYHAISIVFDSMLENGEKPDRALIKAWPVKTSKKAQPCR